MVMRWVIGRCSRMHSQERHDVSLYHRSQLPRTLSGYGVLVEASSQVKLVSHEEVMGGLKLELSNELNAMTSSSSHASKCEGRCMTMAFRSDYQLCCLELSQVKGKQMATHY